MRADEQMKVGVCEKGALADSDGQRWEEEGFCGGGGELVRETGLARGCGDGGGRGRGSFRCSGHRVY